MSLDQIQMPNRVGDANGARRRNARTSDHYEALMRRLQNMDNGSRGQPQTIGLTSCARGEGVSTVAANLAVHAAAVFTRPVLLVDAHAAHPSSSGTFRLKGSPGLVEALSGQIDPTDCIQSSRLDNLSVLAAGSGAESAKGIYNSAALTKVLDALQREFEFIVFDLPTAHQLSPCFTVAAKLDGVLLVIEAECVPSEVAQWAKRQLLQAGANLLGVIFNNRREHLPAWLYRAI